MEWQIAAAAITLWTITASAALTIKQQLSQLCGVQRGRAVSRGRSSTVRMPIVWHRVPVDDDPRSQRTQRMPITPETRRSPKGRLRNPTSRRAVLAGLAALAALPGRALASTGLTLIMVDDPNCGYCRKFDAEIGRGYPRTAHGRLAPLLKVRRKSREIASFNPVVYTPTFLLVRRGEELGRITGYPGADYFYGELEGLMAKAGADPRFEPEPERGPVNRRT
jgi:hypothetical protein